MNVIKIVCFCLILYSCIPIKNVERVDQYKIVSSKKNSEDIYFLFKPEMSVPGAKYSLRRQFSLKDDQVLKSFTSKLFDNYDIEFDVEVSFELDNDEYLDFTPMFFDDNGRPEDKEGGAITFVQIKIMDQGGNNCLSPKSLFYNKTRLLLIEIRDNIKKEDYFRPIVK